MIDTQDSASPIPVNLAQGLDLFAATWLQEFAKIGGHVITDDDGRLSFNVPEFHFSPAFSEPSCDLPESVRDRQTSFRDGHFSGKVRALTDLLRELPGGYQAVRTHMQSHGIRIYAACDRRKAGQS